MKIIENGIVVPINIVLQKKGTNLMRNLAVLSMYLNILRKGRFFMEEKLLKVFKLADRLNNKQSKIYATIHYTANNFHKLEIEIRSKKDFSYIEKWL